MRARGVIAAWITATACSSVDFDELRFRCSTDGECAEGWFCDDLSRACTRGTRDASLSGPCGAGCAEGEVCDLTLGRCRGDCEPSCIPDTVCDLVRNVCVFPRGACLSGPAAATAAGFDASFLDADRIGGQVPRDMVLAGEAYCAADGIRLTDSVLEAGAVWATVPASGRFRLRATVTIRDADPPAGFADGLAIVWARDPPGSLGTGGAFLGYDGMDGYAVEVDTFRIVGFGCTEEAEPETVHVALARTTTTTASSACGAETYAAVHIPGASLRGVDIVIDVEPRANDRARVAVRYADVPVIDVEIPYSDVPRNVGVTSGTGLEAATHVVSALSLERL